MISNPVSSECYRYLQERLKQMEEEKSMAMAAVSKYKVCICLVAIESIIPAIGLDKDFFSVTMIIYSYSLYGCSKKTLIQTVLFSVFWLFFGYYFIAVSCAKINHLRCTLVI